MAEPTAAALAETYAFWALFLDDQEVAAAAAGGHVENIENTLNDIEGSFIQDFRDSVESAREEIAAPLDQDTISDRIEPWIRQFADAINYPGDPAEDDVDDIWEFIYDYWADAGNSLDLNSREFTYPAFTPDGGNVGDGEFIRVTVDENGFDLEGWFPDTYTLICTSDARQLGDTGQEEFEFRGTNLAVDGLKFKGSGLRDPVIAMDARTSEALVTNPSWDSATSAAVASTPAEPTALPGWTPSGGTFTDLKINLDTIYINTPGAPANQSLQFDGNKTISQNLVDVAGASFVEGVPYVFGFALYRQNSADGTLTIRLANGLSGGISRAITVASQTDATWAWYWLVVTPGQNNWLANFNANNLTLSFDLAGNTVGEVILDHQVVGALTRVGAFGDARSGRGAMGTYVGVRSGQTPWVVGDKATATDVEGTASPRAKNQHWLARAGRGYLKAVKDPTVPNVPDK